MKRFNLLWIQMIAALSLLFAATYSFYETRTSYEIKEAHVALLSRTLGESILEAYEQQRLYHLTQLAQRIKTQENIRGFALCDTSNGANLSVPEDQHLEFLCHLPQSRNSFITRQDESWISTEKNKKFQNHIHVLSTEHKNLSAPRLFLIMTEDISALQSAWKKNLITSWLTVFLLSLIIFLGISSQSKSWIKRNLRLISSLLRAMKKGRAPAPSSLIENDFISRRIHQIFNRFSQFKVPHPSSSSRHSSVHDLKNLRTQLNSHHVIVISNREPYIHQYSANRIEMIRPASGLVSALEPILKELGGLWIAHGSGSADFEFVNAQGEIEVPPEKPRYKLRRVSLTQEEEAGYYDGFSNEGLWPLCHHAFQRPRFSFKDWTQYQKVNQKFAQSLPSSPSEKSNLILIQDYHFALLPRLIQQNRPLALSKIALFWHIPWPSAEVFGICPWSKELLTGMLGAHVIGFHTQDHCNNFLETCNKNLEARIDWERFSVTMNQHETLVRSIPIGIETPDIPRMTHLEIQALRTRYQVHAPYVAIGIDRVDYTKGLIERIQGVERFLEKYPEYIGKMTLVQIGSPSRSHLHAYQQLHEELKEKIDRVNARFGTFQGEHPYQPIVFLYQHFNWAELIRFYQWGDVCLVTSLHDGMNLVAKEYAWCQQPERGSLILSRFTGASKDLSGALLVNPYSTEELADALKKALSLSPEEKSYRMRSMRENVESQTAFHWASNLIQYVLNQTDQRFSSSPQEQFVPEFISEITPPV